MTDPVSGPFSNPSSGTNSGTGRFGAGIEIKPHAYDPAANPELFDGVLARRFVAFVIDVVILAIPLIIAWVFIFVFGIVTLGLGWALYGLMSPIAVVWALFYYGTTLGGPASAPWKSKCAPGTARRVIFCSARFTPSSIGSASAC